MILRLNAQVLENRVRPISLHKVPVLDLPMADWIVHSITRTTTRSQTLIANEEVQVFRSTLRRQMRTCSCASSQKRRLASNGWTSRPGTSCRSSTGFGGDCSREDKGWGVVTGESCLCVSLRYLSLSLPHSLSFGMGGRNVPSFE